MLRPQVLLPFNRPSKLFELSDVAQIIQSICRDGRATGWALTSRLLVVITVRGRSHEHVAGRNYCPHIKQQGTLMQIAVRMCDGHNDLGHDLCWQVLACDLCREENVLFALFIFAKIKRRKLTLSTAPCRCAGIGHLCRHALQGVGDF